VVTETQMIGVTTTRVTRADRMAMPLARDVLRDLAVENGACIRPIQLRRTDPETGQAETVLVPCGSTLDSVCPPCAERATTLRAAQCREGWHLEDEPGLTPGPATDDQQWWITMRAEAQRDRDQAQASGQDTSDFDELITDLDAEITKAGIRGKVAPARAKRRHRSTRHRQDAPDLPKRKVSPRTVGKTYTAPDGKTFRPSLFATLTCPSYGRVGENGAPADPQSYEYGRAARDALHFAALFDRFIQNLRRYLGYDVQYFAAIEPQKRLAPHVHIALRGTMARAEIRRVLAATYHQVWWPDTSAVRFDGDQLPVWDEATGNYVDPATGEVLPTWDQALDAIDQDDQPHHVARFGSRFDAQGVLAGSKDAARCIGYLTKYLTKQVGHCHQAQTNAGQAHMARLAEALRFQPCSPTCANWLRYGVQPKNARPGLVPGCCKGKAHDADHLGYAGRRVLVSRKWSGKTLADHRADRQQWLLSMLGVSATDPARYRWELVTPGDPDHMDRARRLLHAVADRARWQAALTEARRRAAMPPDGDRSAGGRAA
jgi:Replication initiator protein, pSAM2